MNKWLNRLDEMDFPEPEINLDLQQINLDFNPMMFQESRPPEKSLDQQINDLWQQADILADWVDDYTHDATDEERWAAIPRLEEMSLQIDELIRKRDAEQQQKQKLLNFNTAPKQFSKMSCCLNGKSCSFLLPGNVCSKGGKVSVFKMDACPLPGKKSRWFKPNNEPEPPARMEKDEKKTRVCIWS
ncbi:hypothetical protein MTBBW1_2620005 [Desulfamplus magnetovallimortis]|uniref:Uncharacterized protein n=1 Tax=Desulfamplus magnetovallimortis TaxID=1246637 RepID=A0A1W1HEV8_9BACT|nr:hypothetical protein [Desulfamplus magnetovallimortis]SLM31041.1 hypothetical protein MTBBW1_2620005 [Desulfamplus magnetovallimortis]